MPSDLRWLALEVESLERARQFYERTFGLSVASETDEEVTFTVGESNLVLRRPRSVPRGGLHTHYAFSAPVDELDDWRDRLDDAFDLTEHQFGAYTSLYLFDPDRHCVEVGGIDDGGSGLTGIFEVVLEVESLDTAESFYRHLGYEPVDRGAARRRVRLDAGSFDLELWEPQLGLADARGGVHVDLGVSCDDPAAVVDKLADLACRVEQLDDGFRIRDPDGHVLTIVPS